MRNLDAELDDALAWHNDEATRLLKLAEKKCEQASESDKALRDYARLITRACWHGRRAGQLLKAPAPYYCPEHDDTRPDGWYPHPCIDCDVTLSALRREAEDLAAELRAHV